jgi:hypothetical protein
VEETDAPLRLPAESLTTSGRASKRSERFASGIVLAVLFAAPALICVHAARAADPDIWWHIRAGEWILQHRAVPHVDAFSGPLGGNPWLDYSWLFELIVAKLSQWLGLVGVVAYSTAMIMAITVAMYRLVRRLQGDFTLTILLTYAAMFGVGHLYTPRPWLFTILLFVLELDILMQVRRTGKLRELLWLPVIFALWSNVHIEFVDGLFVLGLAFAESLLARWWPAARTRVGPVALGGALLASVLGTLANPFGWRIYHVAYDLATQGGALNKVSELQSIPFRDYTDFAILLFALGSTAALAWRRRFPIFETALLIFALVLSFRSQRDVWLIVTVAVAILASTINARNRAVRMPGFATPLAVFFASLAVWVGFRAMHVNKALLDAQVAGSFPVQAVETIRANGYSGPLYNDFNWGGYLIYALRMPVAIDGRQNLYGDQRIDRSVATWNGAPDWDTDPALTSAGIVIGPVKAPLTQLLRTDAHFKLAYEDKLAAVFVARK